MSVTVVKELFDGRQASGDLRQGRKYTRRWRVETNDANDGPLVVTSHPSIPQFGAVYATPNEYDAGALCSNVTATQDSNSQTIWYVTANYSRDLSYPHAASESLASGGPSGSGDGGGTPSQPPGQLQQSPLLRPAIWSFGARRQSIYTTRDYNGKALINSAGQPFASGYQVEVTVPTIDITINKATAKPNAAQTWDNAINSGAWFGLPAKSVKADAPKISGKDDNGQIYYEWQWHLEIAPTAWPYMGKWDPVKVLDCGYAYLDSGKLVQARDPWGNTYSQPILLDGSGGRLAVAGTPVYIDFTFYRAISFSSLLT